LRWISFSLGTLALGILFGVAHRGVGEWIEPELRVPRSAAAVDLAMAVADSGSSAVRRFVEAREDLASLVAARLAKEALDPQAAVAEVELGLPGVEAVAVSRDGEALLEAGEDFEAPAGPVTALQEQALVVARAVGSWQVSARFSTGPLVFQAMAGPQSALVQWRSTDLGLAQIGPARLTQRRAEAEDLGGLLRRAAPVTETEIEVIALPPSSGVGPRLQEGIMWLGLGAFGILALTILLAPAGTSTSAAKTEGPATRPQPATEPTSAGFDTAPAAEPSAEAPVVPSPLPAERKSEPEPVAPTAARAGAVPDADVATGTAEAEQDRATASEGERHSPPSDDQEEDRMAALGFVAQGRHPLADEDEGELEAGGESGPSAVPSEPMQSASLPSLRPGADDEDGDGWSPALPEHQTQPQWPTESSGDQQPSASPKPPESESVTGPPSLGAAAPPSATSASEVPPRTPAASQAPPSRAGVRQPRDASLIAGAQMGGDDGTEVRPFDSDHYAQVYQAFIEARARVGAPASGVSLQAFSRKLESSERSLIEKHGCRAVRFDVVERDGKVTLRPQLVR